MLKFARRPAGPPQFDHRTTAVRCAPFHGTLHRDHPSLCFPLQHDQHQQLCAPLSQPTTCLMDHRVAVLALVFPALSPLPLPRPYPPYACLTLRRTALWSQRSPLSLALCPTSIQLCPSHLKSGSVRYSISRLGELASMSVRVKGLT